MQPARTRWTRRAFLAAAFAAPAGAAYAHLVEPRWLETRRIDVRPRGARLAAPLRILHLADLHANDRASLRIIADAIDQGLAERPDLIVVTGDFITARFDAWAEYRALLARLPAAAPAFACLGNHDGGNWAAAHGGYAHADRVAECVTAAGLRLLDNASVTWTAPGGAVLLTGIGDLWSGGFRAAKAFAGAADGDPALRLLLAHNPDAKDELADRPWHLMLSGHTHGGQVVVPLVGAPFAPVVDYRYIEGLHEWEGRHLFITRGVGSLHGIRFNCRPEVSVLTVAAG